MFLLPLLAAGCPPTRPLSKNQPPDAPTVSIGPLSPRTEDDLVAVLDIPATDPDGDTVSYRYTWKQNGLPRADLTTNTVPASETTKGEVWEVYVTPSDAASDGIPGMATTAVLNTSPEVTIAFTPEAPTTEDDLGVVPTATDADGDVVTFTYTWTLNGTVQVDTGDTILADRTEYGQNWAVTVTPMDDEETGNPVTNEVEIANSVPAVLSITLVPDAPFITDDVMAIVEANDADGDALTYTYIWYVDDIEVQSGESDTLAAGSFSKHQRIRVEVVPNDGIDDGEVFALADVEALNSLPTATGVSIAPVTAYKSSTLTCMLTGFADADGDAEGGTYSWTVNGAPVATTATLDGSLFNKGDSVACTAAPWDGEESGAPITSMALTVSNTAPSLASATLSTLAPTENDTISVSLGAAIDADGDSISYGYDWYVNGSMVTTTSTLLANRFQKGDSIYVVVTPWDGSDYGTPVTSIIATAANTPPSVTTITLSPSTVYTNDTLTASVTATDLDGDTLTYSYDWYVDGFPRGSSTSASLSGVSYFDKGQSVYVVVTPNDGTNDGATGTSSTLTVLNSAPTTPVVEITPNSAFESDDLTCTVTTDSADADGDIVTYSFLWDVDGVAYTGATNAIDSSVVSGVDVGAGETWMCGVEASDGATISTAGTNSLTIDGGFSDYTTAYGSRMIAITAGTFIMGGGAGDPNNTYMDHSVTLTHDFWIGQTELTQAQYALFATSTNPTPSYSSSCGSNCPVEQVSWEDAAKYCNALSIVEGLTPCYQSNGIDLAVAYISDPYSCPGYRLPTEAEWEYTARAGEDTAYSGSNSIDDVAWHYYNSVFMLHATAGKMANAFGLYDMTGNIFEWTNDWYSLTYGGYATGAASIDPAGPSSGSDRVFRGGSWCDDPDFARVAIRSTFPPSVRYYGLGFRLVRTSP